MDITDQMPQQSHPVEDSKLESPTAYDSKQPGTDTISKEQQSEIDEEALDTLDITTSNTDFNSPRSRSRENSMTPEPQENAKET